MAPSELTVEGHRKSEIAVVQVVSVFALKQQVKASQGGGVVVEPMLYSRCQLSHALAHNDNYSVQSQTYI